MKNTFRFFALAAVVAAFASCDKIQDEVPTVKEGRTISLTVGTETKTILKTSGAIWWLSTDRLCVFDNAATPFQFTFTGESNTSASATFVNDNYTGSTPVYAVHFDRNTIEQASYDGTKVITGQVKAAQSIMNKKSFAKDASFSIGKIVQNGDSYSVETMKNCFSLIKFQLNAADIDAISVKGLNNEILAGWVDVDGDKLAADEAGWWTANTTKGAATEIELTVSGSGATDGHFAANSEYYIAVLPQTLSGLEITLTKSNGTIATRTINSSITLNRSKIKEFQTALDHELVFKKGNIVLDCTDASKFRHGNPATALVERTNSIYNPSGGSVLAPFDFWLEGYEDYKFNGQVTQWTGSNPPCLSGVSSSNGTPEIKLPTIDGYKLASVKVTYSHSTSNRTISVTDGTNTFASCSMKRGDDAVTLDLTHPAFTPASDDRYLTYSSELGAKFILTYIPEGTDPGPAPSTDIVIDCTDASQFVDGSGNSLATRSSSIYNTVTSAFDFWLSGKPEYVFNGQVSNWQKTLSAKSKTLVKLPKISGYVLKEVNITFSYSSSNRTYIITDGSADTELDPPYTQLGKVIRSSGTTDETKIDLTGVTASGDERYLTSPGEMCGKFILTYSKVSE